MGGGGGGGIKVFFLFCCTWMFYLLFVVQSYNPKYPNLAVLLHLEGGSRERDERMGGSLSLVDRVQAVY